MRALTESSESGSTQTLSCVVDQVNGVSAVRQTHLHELREVASGSPRWVRELPHQLGAFGSGTSRQINSCGMLAATVRRRLRVPRCIGAPSARCHARRRLDECVARPRRRVRSEKRCRADNPSSPGGRESGTPKPARLVRLRRAPASTFMLDGLPFRTRAVAGAQPRGGRCLPRRCTARSTPVAGADPPTRTPGPRPGTPRRDVPRARPDLPAAARPRA